jgi:hypothetical protein
MYNDLYMVHVYINHFEEGKSDQVQLASTKKCCFCDDGATVQYLFI